MKHKFNKDKILALFALSLLILTVNGADVGDKGEKIIKEKKDLGQYAELVGPETVKLDEETLTVRDETNKKILNHSIELVKIPLTVYNCGGVRSI